MLRVNFSKNSEEYELLDDNISVYWNISDEVALSTPDYFENNATMIHNETSIGTKVLSFEEEDRLEFRDFCQAQERLRQNPRNISGF